MDYSTGSVGIGATAPIWGAIARRYVDASLGGAGTGRQYSLVGDAELDEGAVWEAVLDHSVAELGEIVWIVDLNRQSLDRVVPNIAATRLERMFSGAGWQVITVKFGALLESLFTRPGGTALRERILDMPNPEYQRLLRCTADEVRLRLPGDAVDADAITALIDDLDDATVLEAIRNLGGHDLDALREAYAQIDDTRPTVIIAYTIKGRGLPTQGHPQNHSSLLTTEQYEILAAELGMDPSNPWERFETDSPSGRICAETAGRLARPKVEHLVPPAVPKDIGRTPSGTSTTQAALGRVLLDLSREAPDAAKRVVTLSPDVSSTTNLAGWLNKVGVWSPDERHNWFADDAETIMHWREKPTGQHMELGIAETNLVGLMGELGATWSRWGPATLPHRGDVRPLHRAGSRTVVVRHLRRRAVDHGRHSVGRHLGRRRWCAPVDQDPVHRTGTAGLHQFRTGIRRRRGVDAPRQHRTPRSPGRQLVVSAPVDPSGRSGPGRRYRPIRLRENAVDVRWWPGHTHCGTTLIRPSPWSAWVPPSPKHWSQPKD